MRERIQKLLAARGVGSRRAIEGWIAAGRIAVNGKLAVPGQAVADTDDVRLDGRRLRLSPHGAAGHDGVVYHRPVQEGVRPEAAKTAASSVERLPKSAGRRWIAVSPLAARDGGLELFVTDGKLAAALTRRGLRIPSEFSVRVRGAIDVPAIVARLEAEGTGSPTGRETEVTPAGGEGTNRWLQVRANGLRARDLRQALEACGLEVNRILRTRYGPVTMDRSLSRGRSRPLTDSELNSLSEAAGLRPTGSRKSVR